MLSITDNARINKIDINTANNCVALNSKLSKKIPILLKCLSFLDLILKPSQVSVTITFYQSASADGYYLYNNNFQEWSMHCVRFVQGSLPAA
jgi:hypothetical protein